MNDDIPFQSPPPIAYKFLGCGIGAGIGAIIAWGVGWWLAGWLYGHTISFKVAAGPALFPLMDWKYVHAGQADWLSVNHPWVMHGIYAGVVVLAALVGWLGWLVGHSNHQAQFADRHVRGRRLLQGRDAVNELSRACSAEIKLSGAGLPIGQGLPQISLDRETRPTLNIGSVGGGKTQSMLPKMLAAAARGDQLVIHCAKGDFTASLPFAKDMLIFAPWDSRSPAWNVSADIDTLAAARDFAAALIQEGKGGNPMWSNAARIVLTAALVELQKTKPCGWGFADLAAACSRPQPELAAAVEEHFPEALSFIENANVTTSGILINLKAYLAPIFDLARAWPSVEQRKAFSIKRFVAGEYGKRILVLPSNPQFKELGQGFQGALLGCASRYICLEFPGFSGG